MTPTITISVAPILRYENGSPRKINAATTLHSRCDDERIVTSDASINLYAEFIKYDPMTATIEPNIKYPNIETGGS